MTADTISPVTFVNTATRHDAGNAPGYKASANADHCDAPPLRSAPSNSATLNHLRHLTVLSLSGYQEIAGLALGPHLKSFAEVIGRQRSAQLRALCEEIEDPEESGHNEHVECCVVLRSLWRLAISYLQQNNLSAFLDYAERAESFLEEA